MSKTAPRQNATEQIRKDFERRIARGQWQLGAKLPTSRELAREMNVSVNTVQRALAQLHAQGFLELRRGKTRLVRAITARPSAAPLRKGNQIAIARRMLGPVTGAGWAARIIQAIEQETLAQGLEPVLLPIGEPTGTAAIRERLSRLQDELLGAIVLPQQSSDPVYSELDAANVPWVAINHPRPGAHHNFVTVDFLEAGREVGRAFAKIGLRRVLMFGRPASSSVSWSELIAGFVQSFVQADLPLSGIDFLSDNHSDESVWHASILRYLRKHPAPQGIFAGGDGLGIVAMRACKDFGLRVPEDVSIVGATGLDIARYSDPPLSTIAQPMERIGVEAVRLLVDMARSGVARLPGRLLTAPLVLRGSVKVSDALKQEFRAASAMDGGTSDTYSVVWQP